MRQHRTGKSISGSEGCLGAINIQSDFSNEPSCALNYFGGKWSLTLQVKNVSDEMLLSCKNAPFKAAFVEIQDVLFLVFRYGPFPWLSTPYFPKKKQADEFQVRTDKRGVPLLLDLADANTGKILIKKHIWLNLALSNDMTEKSRKLLAKLKNEEGYFKLAQQIQSQYSDQGEMLDLADPQKVFTFYAL